MPAKRQQQLEEELAKEKAEIESGKKAVAEMAPDRELIKKFVADYYTMRAEIRCVKRPGPVKTRILYNRIRT